MHIIIIYLLIIINITIITPITFGDKSNQKYLSCLDKNDQAHWTRHVFDNDKPLVIETTKRSSHKLVSYILHILIRERLGYDRVELNEQIWDDQKEVVNRLTCSRNNLLCKLNQSVPSSHINMEVWMPPGFTSIKWVTNNLLIDCGPLGPRARTGIFHFDMDLAEKQYRDWRYLTRNSEFPLPNTTNKFISNDLLQILIPCENLSNVWCDSVFAVHKELPKNYVNLMSIIYGNWTLSKKQANEKTLFYFSWYPNLMTIQSTKVSRILTPDCFQSNSKDPVCDDPVNQLTKLIWTGVRSRAPLIFHLVDSFQLNHEVLINMMNQIKPNETDLEFEYRKVACDWIKSHHSQWEPWTEGWNLTKYYDIIILLPKYDDSSRAREKKVFEYSLNHLNTERTIFGSLQFQYRLKYISMECEENQMLIEYLKAVDMEDSGINQPIVGIISSLPTKCLNSVYKISHAQQQIMISYKDDVTSILKQYPSESFIFQTSPSLDTYLQSLIKIAKHFNWQSNFILTDKPNLHSIQKGDIKLKVVPIFGKNDHDIEKILRGLNREQNARIFMTLVDDLTTFHTLLCVAGSLKLTLNRGFVWILNKAAAEFTSETLILPSYKFCAKQIRTITKHHFYLSIYGDNEVLPCADILSDNIYRAMYLIGSSAAKMINSPSTIFNTTILANQMANSNFKDYFCNKELHSFESESLSIEYNTATWNSWYLYQEENHHYHCCFELLLKRRYSITDDFEMILKKRLRNIDIYWDNDKSKIPDDGSLSYAGKKECWVSFIADGLAIKCSTAEISFVLLLAIGLLCLVVATLVSIYLVNLRKKIDPTKEEFRSLIHGLTDVDIPSSGLYLNHVIGRGAFGMVYGGEARNSKGTLQAVAVKAISEESDWLEKIDLLTEAKVMLQLSHPNIVQLIGVCLDNTKNMIFLVMELMVEGDLRNYLLSRRPNPAEYTNISAQPSPLCFRLTDFAKDIAEGLKYMHSKSLIHRDVACRNCLLSHDLRVKLADFGLTIHEVSQKSNPQHKSPRTMTLPIRWMPPEALQFGSFSVKSDIWSYGIVLFEIVTFGVCPYQDYDSDKQLELMDRIKRNQICIVKYLPSSSSNSLTLRLISLCCEYVPRDRPDSMDHVISILNTSDTCIRPYLTDEPPKSESVKQFHNSSLMDLADTLLVDEDDQVPIRAPTSNPQFQPSSSQRYLNLLNKALRSKTNVVSFDRCPRQLRTCHSSVSINNDISRYDISPEVIGGSAKKLATHYIGSIPFDLCQKKTRNQSITIGNIFRISPKVSNNKLK